MAPSSSSSASAAGPHSSATVRPRKHGERRGPQPGQPGLLQRFQQREPLGRDRGAEDARRARHHRGHPHGGERVAHHAAPGRWCARAPRRRPAAPARPSTVRRAAEQARPRRRPDRAATSSRAGPTIGDVAPRRCAAARPRERPARRTGVSHGRPAQPPPGAAPRRRGARRSARRRARRRRTPSPARRAAAASLRWLSASVACRSAVPRGLQVGDDVGAAERVDRLLGVADQHQRGVAVEGAAQDRPLHRVGVLELVDQHHPVARPQPAPRRRGGVGAARRRGG